MRDNKFESMETQNNQVYHSIPALSAGESQNTQCSSNSITNQNVPPALNHQQPELKDILQVKMESLDSIVKFSNETDIILPVMIDIRSGKQSSSETTKGTQSGGDSAVESEGTNNNKSQEVFRRSLDLIFVIDLSISMRGKKMTQLRKTIGNLLEFLTENDRMSVIGFNNSAQKLFKLARLTPQNKKKIVSILGSILPMGLTNITAGLLAAIKELEGSLFEGYIQDDEDGEDLLPESSAESCECPSSILSSTSQQFSEFSSQQGTEGERDKIHGICPIGQRVRSIFLLSDGIDDRCEKNLEMLKVRLQSQKASFSLNAFGYGEQHDAQLMSTIAGFKNGNFYYIEDIQNSDFYFADALGGLFSIVGSNLDFTFELESSKDDNDISNISISKVFGSMWNSPVEEEKHKNENADSNQLKTYKSRSFHFNEIYYGISKQILLELRIPKLKLNGAENDSETLKSLLLKAKGTLRVKDSKGTLVEKTTNLQMKLLLPSEELTENQNNMHNEEVEINYLRVQCAQALQEAMEAALQHNYSQSQNILSSSLAQIAASKIWIQNALVNLTKDLKDLSVTLQKKSFAHQIHSNITNENSASLSKMTSNTQILSCSSSQNTQDLREFDFESMQGIRRAFICKSRAYMEQRSVMMNLEEYENNVQKNLKKQMYLQNKTKTFSAEEEEEKEQEKTVKKKRVLIPLQRKKFSSMNVCLNEIENLKSC